MSLDYSQEVANDLEKLLETGIGSDVIIYAGENENAKELHAHSNILRIRSQYFHTAFSDRWTNKRNGKFILKKPNISPHIFEIILRFIYCRKIDLTKLQGPEVLKLFIAIDELNIQILIPCVQEYLIEHQNIFLQQNTVELLEIVYQHGLFTDLWNYCLERICEGPEMLFNCDKFINLKAPLLELFLKRDDLNLDEIDIWDRLLIEMSPRQRKRVYDSTLIECQHFTVFASWIDKKENLHYKVKYIPYKFNLLYRASRDGNTAAAFHAKCDNKGATIFIAKITNSEQIVGGYNPLSWDLSSPWKSTNDSFIFSFTNRTNFQTAKVGYSKVGYINGVQCSVGSYSHCGPLFGCSVDLYCLNDHWGSEPRYYTRIDIPANFNVEDYEVHQVIKKYYFQ